MNTKKPSRTRAWKKQAPTSVADETPKKNKGGRPTDYRPEYGEMIRASMARGLSLAAAAALIQVHRQQVYGWMAKHPEFADTIALAKVERQVFLENRLLSATESPVINATIFALKNAAGEDWREKSEVEVTHAYANMTDEELERELINSFNSLPPLTVTVPAAMLETDDTKH